MGEGGAESSVLLSPGGGGGGRRSQGNWVMRRVRGQYGARATHWFGEFAGDAVIPTGQEVRGDEDINTQMWEHSSQMGLPGAPGHEVGGMRTPIHNVGAQLSP